MSPFSHLPCAWPAVNIQQTLEHHRASFHPLTVLGCTGHSISPRCTRILHDLTPHTQAGLCFIITVQSKSVNGPEQLCSSSPLGLQGPEASWTDVSGNYPFFCSKYWFYIIFSNFTPSLTVFNILSLSLDSWIYLRVPGWTVRVDCLYSYGWICFFVFGKILWLGC